MLGLQKMMERLCRELEEERRENARFRRMMEDVLYNLEEENMPSVSRRIREGEKSLALLVEDGAVRGSVLIEAINGASLVQIDADRINLNGAVTANGNFKINTDGSVACQALSLTGGEILLPDPQDGSPVLRVETPDAAGGVTVFADRIAFDGDFIPNWHQEASLGLEQLSFFNSVEESDGSVTDCHAYVRPTGIRLTRKDTGDEEFEASYSAYGISVPRIYKRAVRRTENMRPLYIDANGSICAVLNE